MSGDITLISTLKNPKLINNVKYNIDWISRLGTKLCTRSDIRKYYYEKKATCIKHTWAAAAAFFVGNVYGI